MAVAVSAGGFEFEQAPLWTDITVQLGVVSEMVFANCAMGMGMSAVSQNGLNVCVFNLVCDGCVVVARIQAHEERHITQSVLYLFEIQALQLKNVATTTII